MKTTVEIADSLFAEAKAYTEAHGLSFRELLEEGLRSTLQRNRQGAKPFRLRMERRIQRDLNRDLPKIP